jgi:hypothetical protein
MSESILTIVTTSATPAAAFHQTFSEKSQEGLLCLPIDVLRIIFSFVDKDDLSRVTARFVCRKFRDLIQPRKSYKGFCEKAARVGYLSLLQWARANGCPWNGWTCAGAAEGGHLEILKWARANGCPWDEMTCSGAAKSGHLEVLQWVRANVYPWDKWTCARAAYGGHLEVLKWARANGCPWDEMTCANAAKGDYLEVLKWARANGAPERDF